jgi:CBS domain-containing protein
MDSDPRALGLRVPVCSLTPASTIAEAAAQLRATGSRTAVVMRRGEPMGLVGEEAVLDAVRTGRSEAPLASLIDRVVVRVDPHEDVRGTLQRFNDAAWDWLLLERRPRAGGCDPLADGDRTGGRSPRS